MCAVGHLLDQLQTLLHLTEREQTTNGCKLHRGTRDVRVVPSGCHMTGTPRQRQSETYRLGKCLPELFTSTFSSSEPGSFQLVTDHYLSASQVFTQQTDWDDVTVSGINQINYSSAPQLISGNVQPFVSQGAPILVLITCCLKAQRTLSPGSFVL